MIFGNKWFGKLVAVSIRPTPFDFYFCHAFFVPSVTLNTFRNTFPNNMKENCAMSPI